MEKTDSSYDQKYVDKANQKDDRKSILRNHLAPLGVDMTSKFAQASLAAMREAAEPGLVPIEPPIGDVILEAVKAGEIAQLNLSNGAYYHYIDVCKLMNKVKSAAVQDTQEKPDRPDFEKILTEMYGHSDVPSDRIIGVQDCYNIYVLPLKARIVELEKQNEE